METTLKPVSLRLTPEEYFAWEETQLEKYDFINGEVFPTSGASRIHNRLMLNIATLLVRELDDERCEVFATDMRVETEPGARYSYPDIAVVCDEPRFLGFKENTLLNPTLVIEVLSESTEAYDRGDKLIAYREVESVMEIALVSQKERSFDVYRRDGENRWSLETRTSGGLVLESVGVEIALDDLYARTGI